MFLLIVCKKEWKAFVIAGLLDILPIILLKRTADRKTVTILFKKSTCFYERIYLEFKIQSSVSFAG
jgi:hypothetical protein